ncbi:MAG: glycoside hydrolase family 2 protein, partial [Oscillospiraceae bacterium]|nr:glycoside hydrolase family 2 protein [Oscillospiraceae bacterium]
PTKPYMITEYNGHMFPTKSFDSEDHRLEHALRHARVLNAAASHEDICGSFGWCMADYNTHKDFGSGDRICYHGVLDMFRNPKPAAAVYASQQDKDVVLELSSGMEIGEHPASQRGEVWVFSNADSVKMYKNGKLLKEYFPKNNKFPHLPSSPILVDDYIGSALSEGENYPPKLVELLKKILNHIALYGYNKLPPKMLWPAFRCMVLHGMKRSEITDLYTKYIGDWGSRVTEYRFDAIRNGQVVKTVTKAPMSKPSLQATVSSSTLKDTTSYDVAAVRLKAVDDHGNLLYFCNEPLKISAEGPVEIIGGDMVSLKGGMTGIYVRSTGTGGSAAVTVSNPQLGAITIPFEITLG